MLGPMRALRFRRAAVLLALTALAAPVRAAEPALRFERDGALVREVPVSELRANCGAQRVTVPADPYYDGRTKHYLACPLREVLVLGFGVPPAPGESYFLRALDGYERPASGAQLAEAGGWLAFADADASSGWEPLGRRQLDPGPLFLVWTGAAQRDPERHPWPYQLAAIERAAFETRMPHTAPGTPAGSPASRGYEIFRSDCIACHAINGEGGKVGPDLNVPRSIVEYRPADEIKAYVRNPQSFRYTTMPAHPGLSDADLDALVAYFEAMSQRKHDPGPGGSHGS